MRICFISQEYPPETGWGGIGSYTYEMARGLVGMGHHVIVISRAVGRPRVDTVDGVEIHRVHPGPDWGKIKGMWRINHVWPGFAWMAAKRLERIHGEKPVDLVEAPECRADGCLLPLFRMKWRKKPKYVVRLHTPSLFVHRWNHLKVGGRKKFEYFLEKQAVLRSDAITAPTRAVLGLTASWVSWKKPDYVIPNPIDSETFRPSVPRERKGCLFVGRLEKHKGIAVLTEALPAILADYPESTFRFAGKDGVDEQGVSWRHRILANLPAEAGSRVIFEELSRSELIRAYQSAAVCVFPSLWENCPYVLLEAMACGTPAVVTNAGGFPELVEDGENGLLVPPGDPIALKNAVEYLLGNPLSAVEMGAKARERVRQQFDTRHIVPEMLGIYREILYGR